MILDIDLVSDFVCPWCLIGKTRLARALEDLRASRPDIETRINWLPFFLNPDTPPQGEPYRPFLEAKFGGPRGADAVLARVAEAGAEDGIEFAFERIATRPNTLRAHSLMYRFQAQGFRQDQVRALSDALFAAHFQQGRDIGDIEVLAELAAACGDRVESARTWLESGAGEDKVRTLAAQVRRLGVNGVPFFILGRRLSVEGAQSPAILGAAMLQACTSGEPH